MDLREVVLAHEPDVAWIIALWLSIHGGDPGPESAVEIDESTALLAVALSARLSERHGLGPVTHEVLQERFGAVVIPADRAAVPRNGKVAGKKIPEAPDVLACVRFTNPSSGDPFYFCWPSALLPAGLR